MGNHNNFEHNEARQESRSSEGNFKAHEHQESSSRTQVDNNLHGDKVGVLNEHLKNMSDVNASQSPETANAAKAYAEYKQNLVGKVFDKHGNINDNASTEDMARLYDLNKAEISATQERVSSIYKAGSSAIAVNQFESQGNPKGNTLPDKLGV